MFLNSQPVPYVAPTTQAPDDDVDGVVVTTTEAPEEAEEVDEVVTTTEAPEDEVDVATTTTEAPAEDDDNLTTTASTELKRRRRSVGRFDEEEQSQKPSGPASPGVSRREQWKKASVPLASLKAEHRMRLMFLIDFAVDGYRAKTTSCAKKNNPQIKVILVI